MAPFPTVAALPESTPAAVSPTLRAGIGLRSRHHRDIIERRPAVGWLEAHTENYLAAGGLDWQWLERARAQYPLSLHGVGLSIGSTDPIDRPHLARIACLVREFEPLFVSEHLSWSSVNGRFSNDLLPLPYNEESLIHLASRVSAIQDELGCQILIENISSYLQFQSSTLTEWGFLACLAELAGCALLLDVNNVYVNACNHGFDAVSYLEALPPAAVKEIHLAGHQVCSVGDLQIRIDTHDTRVCDAVWELYAHAAALFPGVPALIEWDAEIPELDVLVAEARIADTVARSSHVAAA
jgi:hypothetical protein